MRFTYSQLDNSQKHKSDRIFHYLSVESVAKLCFKSVKTVEKWKMTGCIPPESKRLIRKYLRQELSHEPEWSGFYMEGEKLRLPTGQLVEPQQIILAIALLELGSKPETLMLSKIHEAARAIVEVRRFK